METNKLYLGDYQEVIKQFPDGCIDTIITDIPYGIADNSKLTLQKNKIVSTKEAWGSGFQDDFSDESYVKFIDQLAENSYRILKEGGNFITFFDRSKPHRLKKLYDLFDFKNMIVFVKVNTPCHIRKNNYRSGFEQCAWFSKGKPTAFNFVSQPKMKNVFYGPVGRKETQHPTEKYLWMIRPLIERHTNPGDIVLDPFMGSGTTAACCIEQKRKYIGIEKNPEYCKMAVERIEKITDKAKILSKQHELF